MKKRVLHTFTSTLFLASLLGIILIHNITVPRILVLNSYEINYPWGAAIEKSMRMVLDHAQGVIVRWHYMETKIHPEKRDIEKAGMEAADIIKDFRPTVIISIFDNAVQYVVKSLKNVKGVTIVLSALNGTLEDYDLQDATNVTGVVERLPFGAIRDCLIYMYPEKKGRIRIINMVDKATTSLGKHRHYKEFKDWGRIAPLPGIVVDTWDEWKAGVKKANEESDALVISNYRQVYRTKVGGERVPPQEVLQWTYANVKVPLFAASITDFVDGAYFSIASSPYEQGMIPAQIALQIARHPNTPLSPIRNPNMYVIALSSDYKTREPRLAHLPDIYVMDAHDNMLWRDVASKEQDAHKENHSKEGQLFEQNKTKLPDEIDVDS